MVMNVRQSLASTSIILACTATALVPAEAGGGRDDEASGLSRPKSDGAATVIAQAGPPPMGAEHWRMRAQAGDPSAQLALGTAYAAGRGVEPDARAAASWFTKAAEAGNTSAQYNLGILHVTQGDFAAGYRWFAIGRERAKDVLRIKALCASQIIASVLMHDALQLAERDALDWLEEFDPAEGANQPTDSDFAFARLRVPRTDTGWRAIAKQLPARARTSMSAVGVAEAGHHGGC
jgi:hypothetical protein